ncbi:MAG: hypothetical protein EBT10_04075 [Methylocystaceae bacterium]|nr:hypothetical protein [Methylocystaceae bacterium]
MARKGETSERRDSLGDEVIIFLLRMAKVKGARGEIHAAPLQTASSVESEPFLSFSCDETSRGMRKCMS